MNHKFDLVFLDIDLPDISGFDILRSFDRNPNVIFTTGHPEFALQAFDLDAVDSAIGIF